MGKLAQKILDHGLVDLGNLEMSELGPNDSHFGFDLVEGQPTDFALGVFRPFCC
jgi:hypothetical protein